MKVGYLGGIGIWVSEQLPDALGIPSNSLLPLCSVYQFISMGFGTAAKFLWCCEP